jgi:DNA-binding transcriptional ArsR family regulator
VAGSRVHLVENPEALQALAHPVRVRVLEALREPGSAAMAARAVGQPRQNIAHHLKELVNAGLARKVGERRKGNFIEALYQAVAPTIVVSPRAAWGDSKRTEALRGQMSLENLVLVGERLGRDAAALLDRAAFDGEEIASAAVEAEVRFDGERARAAFMDEYLKAVGPLLRKYGRKGGMPHRVVLAVYPDPDHEETKP